jgi:protein phosphatase
MPGCVEIDDSEAPTGEYPTMPASGTPHVQVSVAGRTHPGKVREKNEDQFLIAGLAKSMRVLATSLPESEETQFADEVGYLMVVADGMGGVAGGEQASRLAVGTVERFVLNAFKWFLGHGDSAKKEESVLVEELRSALKRADRTVFERADADPSLTGMGTTLTLAYSVADDLYIVHAGDTRAYLFRDGGLHQVTHDHTLVQMLVDSGSLSPEAARFDRRRHIVTNVIGGPRPGVRAEIHKAKLLDGDMLVLCSDGLTEAVAYDRIAAILGSDTSADEACSNLIAAALAEGGPDNVTAIVASYRVN